MLRWTAPPAVSVEGSDASRTAATTQQLDLDALTRAGIWMSIQYHFVNALNAVSATVRPDQVAQLRASPEVAGVFQMQARAQRLQGFLRLDSAFSVLGPDAVATLTGHITPWLLLALTFALSAGDAFETPIWRAVLPELVRKEDLPAASALNGIEFNIAP